MAKINNQDEVIESGDRHNPNTAKMLIQGGVNDGKETETNSVQMNTVNNNRQRNDYTGIIFIYIFFRYEK